MPSRPACASHRSAHVSVNFLWLELAKSTLGVLCAAHWLACLWGLQASFDRLASWQGQFGYCRRALADGDVECMSASSLYSAAMYWCVHASARLGFSPVMIMISDWRRLADPWCRRSVMTISGVGLGYHDLQAGAYPPSSAPANRSVEQVCESRGGH